jgi:hypothetical protein
LFRNLLRFFFCRASPRSQIQNAQCQATYWLVVSCLSSVVFYQWHAPLQPTPSFAIVLFPLRVSAPAQQALTVLASYKRKFLRLRALL